MTKVQCEDCGSHDYTCGRCGAAYVIDGRVLTPGRRPAAINAIDGEGSEVEVRVTALREDEGNIAWYINVRPHGDREMRVYFGESMEAEATWQNGEWL